MSALEPEQRGRWQKLPDLDQPRSHTPTVVIDDKVYIFGGGGPQFKSLDTSCVFDPKTQKWDFLNPMPTKRSGTVGCVVDGKAYILGGGFKQANGEFKFLTTVEIYDPKTDTWASGPELNQPHDYPGGLVLGEHIYILGGHHPDATKGGPKTDPGFDYCERLNLRTGRWEEIASLPTPRFALSSVTHDGKILAMGGVAFRPEGFNNFTTIEEFDPATGAWQIRSDFALPWPAAGQSNCILNDDLYTFGGYSGDGIHPRVARYDSTAGKWLQLPNIPAPRAAAGIAVNGNNVYLVGGWADDGRTPQTSFYCYERNA